MTARQRLFIALVLPLLAACGSTPGKDDTAPRAGTTRTIALDERPFQLHVPGTYTPGVKAPLVVLLHGYGASAAGQEDYFKLTAESDRRGFLYAMPEGTTDPQGRRFWNATAACCDFSGTGVDDSGYLRLLLDTVQSAYTVDTARVYLIGHSNGGFMAYRMACEHATKITAIVSLAGAATNDAAACMPQRPVSILQIHGTADRVIQFAGGANAGQAYPSAASTVALWRGRNGCADQASAASSPIDLDAGLPGAETTVTAYLTGCRDATRVELWSIQDGGHIPALTPGFAPAVMDYLLARATPS